MVCGLVLGIGLRRLGCGCGRRLVTGSCVIRETTQTGCPWSRPRVSLSILSMQAWELREMALGGETSLIPGAIWNEGRVCVWVKSERSRISPVNLDDPISHAPDDVYR